MARIRRAATSKVIAEAVDPRNWFQIAAAFVLRMTGWLTLIFWLVLLAAVVVVQYDIIEPPPDQAITFYVVMMSTVLAAQSRHIVELYKRLRTRLSAHQEETTRIREILQEGGRLFTLGAALRDLAPRLDRLRSGEEVSLDYIGLDLSTAWDKMRPMLEQLVLTKKVRVSFRLLVLHKDAWGATGPDPVPLPEEVVDWVDKGSRKSVKIEGKLRAIRSRALAVGLAADALNYQLRSYRDLPTIHGIRILKPFEIAYVALSRWDEDKQAEFWWGGDEYHRVLERASDSRRDLRAAFDGYFERWWQQNDPAKGAAGFAAAS